MDARTLVRTGALIVASQVVVALLGVLALRLYTDLVTPAVFGESNLVLSALGLGLQLFVAGFTAAMLRFYSDSESKGTAEEFTRETMTWALRAATALVLLLVAALLIARLLGVVRYSAAVAVGGVGWIFAMTVRSVLMSRIQAQRRQSAYARLQVLEAALLVAATSAALHLAPSVESFLLGQTLAIALLVSFIVTTEYRGLSAFRVRLPKDGDFGRRAWFYGAPFVPMSFLSWLANLGDRYTLAALLGSAAAGRYVAPFSIASRGMLLANSALCDLFRPLLFDAENRRDADGSRKTFLRWIISSIAMSSAGLAVVYFAGTLLAGLLLAPEYRLGAMAIMLWVSLGYAVSGITQVVENRLLSLGHSARLLLPMVLGAAANIGFSIVFIRRNGIIGAAQATCASFVFQNLATTPFLFHALRERRKSATQEITVEPA